jgi:colicin import membrane protein
MNLPKHINILMASAVTFSIAVSPIEISVAHAQSAPAAEAPGDSGWQKEFELWRASNKGGKPADYQKYLRVYPNGKFANVAKRRIEELTAATQPAVPADETAAVNDAAKNVPADDAQASADAAKDVELWRQVSKTGKQADYEKYLKQFPNGKFAKVAKTRIDNLVAKAKAPEEAVETAAKTMEPPQDDQAEVQDQADSQPDAQDQAGTDDAQQPAADDNAATVTAQADEKPAAAGADWEQEYALWKAASDGNTVTEYEAYLRAYPNGKFAAIAQARVVQLTAAEQPDPTIAEGDDAQNDASKANVAGNRKNKTQQSDDQAAEDDQSQPADDQAQDTANQDDMQSDDTAAADRQNSMRKQGGLNQQQDQAQDQQQDQQQARYTEGSEDVEDAVLDREQRHEMQGRLSALGYDTLGTDGAFGPRTRDAIASWQQDNGAPVTGYLSEDQIDAIRVASAASYATWLATAAPVVIRRVRPRAEWVVVRPRVVVRRPAAVVVVKPFGRRYYRNRVKVKVRFGGCRKRRRC